MKALQHRDRSNADARRDVRLPSHDSCLGMILAVLRYFGFFSENGFPSHCSTERACAFHARWRTKFMKTSAKSVFIRGLSLLVAVLGSSVVNPLVPLAFWK